MEPIYNVKGNIESVKKRIENSELPKSVKDKIFEFVNILKEGSGIKEHRQFFYYERLIILSEVLGEKILNPSKLDVINAISKLRDRITIRHTAYSPSTISDFKKVLKKFVKYVNDGELPKFWNDIHADLSRRIRIWKAGSLNLWHVLKLRLPSANSDTVCTLEGSYS